MREGGGEREEGSGARKEPPSSLFSIVRSTQLRDFIIGIWIREKLRENCH